MKMRPLSATAMRHAAIDFADDGRMMLAYRWSESADHEWTPPLEPGFKRVTLARGPFKPDGRRQCFCRDVEIVAIPLPWKPNPFDPQATKTPL